MDKYLNIILVLILTIMQQLHFISTSPFYKDVLENVYKYNKSV